MSFLSDNIRYLRTQLNCSQQKVADELMITRGRYAKYEDGASEPPLEILIKISKYFHVSIDLLLTVDLRKISFNEMLTLADNRILLPIQVDNLKENTIEIIPHKASMGYLNGYSDPEYIESLDTVSLPFLSAGKYRAFPANGDSMPPHKDGSYIIGKYIDNPSALKKGKSYIFITRQDGITYKRLNQIEADKLILSADNILYEPYTILLSDIFEIWEFACSIATKEYTKDDFQLDNQLIINMFKELKERIQELTDSARYI
ncbi:MAG: helix-turn-helix domain-containing protein [Chitinophagales bacterium]|nr:helix-turn-helix domain-containing protein [Chitinophagales bacterium]MCZ2393568.1 helix-turn-helix domain-containing protein [Chitinophagales bacterium]